MPTTPAASDHHAEIPVMVVAGPPGAGKSTAMRTLRQELPGLLHFGVRVFFERQMELGSSLGQRAKVFNESKIWHPDELIFEGIAHWLEEGLSTATLIVLEGFPRNRSQALALDSVLGEYGLRVNRTVHLDVPDDIAAARITNREVCLTCDTIVADAIPLPGTACARCGQELVRRPDDDELSFRRRLTRQRQTRDELLAHYETLGVLVEIDGTRAPAEVAQALLLAVPAAPIAASRDA